MRRRRYHRVREGPFPPSGRADDGPRAGPVTPERGSDAAPAAFDPGLAGLHPRAPLAGMFHAASDGLEARLATNRPITAYNGFDPSGPWLHIGHLVPIFGLIQLQRHGGRPIALVGGGTGMIGDPSGRSSERNLLSRERLEANVASMRPQLERFLDFDGPRGAIDGEQPRLARADPPARLPPRRRQALHDPVHARQGLGPGPARGRPVVHRVQLHAHPGDRLPAPVPDARLRAADGRRRPVGQHHGGPRAHPAHLRASARTAPRTPSRWPTRCCSTQSGAKFGKSETGDSVWLHPDGTSPYAFYQHWLNTDDRDVSTYLRWFTTFEPARIVALEAALAAAPERREAQRELATDLTTRVHGAEEPREAMAASEAAFSGSRDRRPGGPRDAAPRRRRLRLHARPTPRTGSSGSSSRRACSLVEGRGPPLDRRRRRSRSTTAASPRPTASLPEPIAGEWYVVRIGKRRVRVGRRAGLVRGRAGPMRAGSRPTGSMQLRRGMGSGPARVPITIAISVRSLTRRSCAGRR